MKPSPKTKELRPIGLQLNQRVGRVARLLVYPRTKIKRKYIKYDRQILKENQVIFISIEESSQGVN